MAQTLVTVVSAIEEEYGEEVEVQVANTEALLVEEEAAAMRELPGEEKVFVLLSMLGYDGETSHAAEGMQLSGEATALMETMRTRVDSMTQQQRDEFDALIAQYFPVTQQMIDGELVNCIEITLEIRLPSGQYRLEKYTFIEKDGAWTLAGIAAADAAATEPAQDAAA